MFGRRAFGQQVFGRGEAASTAERVGIVRLHAALTNAVRVGAVLTNAVTLGRVKLGGVELDQAQTETVRLSAAQTSVVGSARNPGNIGD